MATNRYTILEADRKPFPKASDNIAEPGKVSTDPEMIEQPCELITEHPEGQDQTSHCNTTELETRKGMYHDEQTYSFSAPFPFARRIRSGRHGTISGFLCITMPLPCGR
jgi:hypothetical protein